MRTNPLNTTLKITSFEDPLYTVETYGRVISIIQEANITDFVVNGNTSNLTNHIDNSYYIPSTSAPSFLMRLKGNISNSTNGIESLVNLKKLESVGITPEVKSCVDYIYFSSDDPTNWQINNTFNWFRLDNESGHLDTYEVANLTI